MARSSWEDIETVVARLRLWPFKQQKIGLIPAGSVVFKVIGQSIAGEASGGNGWKFRIQADLSSETGAGQDEKGCNACESTLKYSPNHFSPLPGRFSDAAEAMAWVDRFRPW
jgi:hypothetical protein